MSLTVKDTGADFELAPADQYTARCYRVIDLGTQASTYEGKTEQKHKVLFMWELLSGATMKDGRPFCVGRRFNASLHEKADLRKTLESWRGAAFTDEQLNGFKLTDVLGAYCLMQVVHENGYANVQSLMKMPTGMPKPKGINDAVSLDFDDFDWLIFDTLSERLRETIAASPEFKDVAAARTKAATQATPAKKLSVGIDIDDDIPF
jgi:hypothetical protein